MNFYDIGDITRIGATFTIGGSPDDPTTVKLRVLKPDQTELTYIYAVGGAMVRASVGTYRLDLTLLPTGDETASDISGWWYYRWEATGYGEGAEEGYFNVRSTAFNSPQ